MVYFQKRVSLFYAISLIAPAEIISTLSVPSARWPFGSGSGLPSLLNAEPCKAHNRYAGFDH
jgi:hypothetical protein